ncbi:tripartite tricarboxylate transporter TctB family protein [Halomonas sp. ANAO-440]|uniref:tripartite tricarboxylate transporter TctB family protein n=1 Tax=Halomonas sp. ANAO-440 TaxID=2861360 RepID=UPI001CAA4748|nr:tripartite tricarboxylate transporter TctB family protein [Halomonas sp. ANAO-440]MBZ0331486.1 tripartite tricarboxylate transporter TctB family protein [Halomonas sp. ANAO-440]
MRLQANRDFLAGFACLVMSVLVLWKSQEYALGSLQRMGPGFMPTVLGLMLAACGVIIMVFSRKTTGNFPRINVRALFFIILGILVFSLLMDRLGVFVATIFLVVISRLSEARSRLLSTLALSLALCVLVYLIFSLGLGMPLRLFPWSF